MMKDADAQLLIAEEGLLPLVPDWQGRVLLTKDIINLPKAGQLPEPPKPEDLFILLYTSGSTGNSKGVMLSYGNLWSNVSFGLTKIDFLHKGTAC